MTETGTTVTIRPGRAPAELVPPESPDGDEERPLRGWFTGAAPGSRSPWKGTVKVGMR